MRGVGVCQGSGLKVIATVWPRSVCLLHMDSHELAALNQKSGAVCKLSLNPNE